MNAQILGILITAFLFSPSARAASFQLLGDFPGGSVWSEAHAISGDGTTVVGMSDYGPGMRAFLWTQSSGMVGLTDPTLYPFSRATGVSYDGSVVVGFGTATHGSSGIFRWTASTGVVGVGFGGLAWDISNDGTTIVGETTGGGFRWTTSGEFDSSLGRQARAVSGDGSVVVGSTGFDYTGTAFQWTESGGLQLLSGVIAMGVSPDGNAVVGYRLTGATGFQPFLWTPTGGLKGLGHLPGGTGAVAHDVSADGRVVVGFETPAYSTEAFIWDESHGMRSIRQVLTSSGLNLGYWRLTDAYGISDDGNVIVGAASNPYGEIQAWIAVIPEPSAFSLLGAIVFCLAAARRRRSRGPRLYPNRNWNIRPALGLRFAVSLL